MGIKSTMDITRENAITRINKINEIVADKDYRRLEGTTSEHDHDLRDFVDNGTHPTDISKWTNSMLEDLMDEPFYRYSMFDNYSIISEGE